MKSIEKILLVVIVLLVLSRVGILLKDIWIISSAGADGLSIQQKIISQYLSFIFFAIVNIGSSVWLYIEAAKSEMKTWVWTVFGLFFGLMAVAIFYLAGIYNHLKFDEFKKET
jgi:hypothetical protein